MPSIYPQCYEASASVRIGNTIQLYLVERDNHTRAQHNIILFFLTKRVPRTRESFARKLRTIQTVCLTDNIISCSQLRTIDSLPRRKHYHMLPIENDTDSLSRGKHYHMQPILNKRYRQQNSQTTCGFGLCLTGHNCLV